MPLIVRAYPVLPGKEAEVRKLAAEMAGARRQEAEDFYRSFGVVRESWHFQETPHGALVIGVTDVTEPDARAQEYAASTKPFDSWFKEQVRNLTGIDPNVSPLGPVSELIYDTQAEEPVEAAAAH
jgi:hypothetical protein